MSKNSYSIIKYHSKQENNRCGYCRRKNSSCSHGMTAYKLNVNYYQSLIDRGWRRCGSYCYKPMMKYTCCPHYTIKCEALDFKLSKSQKKIFKRMIKFLKNELPTNEDKTSRNKCDEDIVRNMEIPDFSEFGDITEQSVSKMEVSSVSEELHKVDTILNNNKSNSSKEISKDVPNSLDQPMDTKDTTCRTFDPSRGPQKKAKLLRIERKYKKLLAQGKTQEEINAIMNKRKTQNNEKTLEDLFDDINNCSNKLELKLVRTSPESDIYKNSAKESFELYKKYQKIIHGDKLSKLTEDRYKRFLVRSPLREWTPENGPPHGYGSFHEQYWFNGTLIAVGVIDILPSCISSVYFFYDPSYSHLSLGTFSSLREVYLTRQLNKYTSDLKYYYMGYYIHSCTKMRYKARMRPSKLLCPETYLWCDIDKCLPKLDISSYSRLNEDLSITDEDGVMDVQQVLILYNNKAMPYGVYRRFVQDENMHREIQEYASLVGRNCASHMLYYIDD